MPCRPFDAAGRGVGLRAALGPAAVREIDRCGGRDVLVVSNLVFAAGLVLLALRPADDSG